MSSIRSNVGNGVSEIRALTGLRGIASLYVVLFHYFQPLPLVGYLRTLLGHGYLAVDLFFVLSGFVMALNYGSRFAAGAHWPEYRLFLCRRFARVYPLFLFASVVGYVLVRIGRLEFTGPSLNAALSTNAVLIQNWGFWESIDTPSWSISAEWFAYIVFPILLALLYRGRRLMAAVGGLCLLCLVGLNLYGLRTSDTGKLFDFTRGPLSLIRCVSEFWLGMLLVRIGLSPAIVAYKRKAWVSYTVSAAILLLLTVPKTDLVLVCFFPLLILSLTGRPNLITRVLGCRTIGYLGLLSFSIYLLHVLLNGLIESVDHKVHAFGYMHSHSYGVAVGLLMLFPLSALTYRIIEVPGRRWLRGVLEGRSAKTVGP